MIVFGNHFKLFPLFSFLLTLHPLTRVSSVWTTNDLTPKNYNPLRLPKVENDKPVVVKVTVIVISLLKVDEAEQSFTADIVYKLRWADYRLQLPVLDVDYPLILEPSWKSRIWTPDVYFQNALRTSLLTGFTPITFIEIMRNNDVTLSARLTVKLNCDMELFSYPHDTQECFFDSMSLTHSRGNIALEWDLFVVDTHIYFPKFHIFEFTEQNCTHPDFSENHSITEPSKSCIRGVVKMSRKLSYYITRYYAPSFLIVLTSMVGFWIPPAAWPARVTVVVTPLLSLITIHNTLNSELNVSYLVAIHIYMFASMTLIFLALIEYALVIVYVNTIEDRKARALAVASSGGESPESVQAENGQVSNGNGFPFGKLEDKKPRSGSPVLGQGVNKLMAKVYGKIDWKKAPLNRNKVDYLARIFFPLFYLLFILAFAFIFVIPWLIMRH